MEKLENIFIGFRNMSFDEIIKLNVDHVISNKEKLIFKAVFENSTNLIASFIKEMKASKSVEEKDFDWMMLLYVLVCIQELHDILDRIEKTDDVHIKNTLDVNKQDLINHLKKILGGRDIDSIVDKTLNHIESSGKESDNYNEFIVGRTYVIFSMLKENKVNIENISSEKLLQISEENYKNSISTFVNICLKV